MPAPGKELFVQSKITKWRRKAQKYMVYITDDFQERCLPFPGVPY
jgi:hypothetical protein